MEIKKLFIVQGTRRQRIMIYLLTLLLAYLVNSACDSLLTDFNVIPQPIFENYTAHYLSKDTLAQVDKLTTQIAAVNEQLNNTTIRRQSLQENSATLKKTIDQLTEQTRAAGSQLSVEEVKAKANSLNLFIENQKHDQELAREIIALTNQKQALQEQYNAAQKTLDEQRKPAEAEYNQAMKQYHFNVAALQIGAICILLVLSTLLLLRSQDSKFKLIAMGVFLGIFLQALNTFYYYFPAFYFKYIVIFFLIGLTIYGLLNAIQFAQSKQIEVLLKRYRDAYTYFLCPICEFPIRRGPMTFAYWTRRSIVNCRIETQQAHEQDKPYTCPVCATDLFKECEKCHETRYGLLPACQHCGDKENLQADA